MSTPQMMTVDEALAAGYEKCLEDGYSSAIDIGDVDWENTGGVVYLLGTERKTIQFDKGWLREKIQGEVEDREDEVMVEDLTDRVMDFVDAELNYEEIEKKINEALIMWGYWEATGIELQRPQTEE